MSGSDEVEAAIGERQPVRVGFDDIDATRAEPVTGHSDVGAVRLGHRHARRQNRSLVDDLTAAGIDVEGRGRRRQPPGEETCVTPGWSLLSGAPIEPAEPPPGDIGGLCFGDELVECAHVSILAHTTLTRRAMRRRAASARSMLRWAELGAYCANSRVGDGHKVL
jgi:hypothetical protein